MFDSMMLCGCDYASHDCSPIKSNGSHDSETGSTGITKSSCYSSAKSEIISSTTDSSSIRSKVPGNGSASKQVHTTIYYTAAGEQGTKLPRCSSREKERSSELSKEVSTRHTAVPSQIIVNNGDSKIVSRFEDGARHRNEKGSASSSLEDERKETISKALSDSFSRSRDGNISETMSTLSTLEVMRRRNMEIGLKRREEIANARKRQQRGKRLIVPTTSRSPKDYDDSSSVSSSLSRFSESSSLSRYSSSGYSIMTDSKIICPRSMRSKLSKVQKKEVPVEDYSSVSSTFEVASYSKSVRSTKTSLGDFADRNREIASKRKEAIAKARAASKATARILPSVSSYRQSRSSFTTEDSQEKSPQARFDRLYAHGKSKNRTDIARASLITGDKNEMRSSSRLSGVRTSDAINLEETKSKKTQQHLRRLQDVCDTDSSSVHSTVSKSRFDRLYEAGKRKNRDNLRRYIEDKEETRSKSVTRPNPKINLNERTKRNREAGMKRREEIARGRAASNPKPRELPKVYNPVDAFQSRKIYFPGDSDYRSFHELHTFAMA